MNLMVRLDPMFAPSIVPRPPNQVAGAIGHLSISGRTMPYHTCAGESFKPGTHVSDKVWFLISVPRSLFAAIARSRWRNFLDRSVLLHPVLIARDVALVVGV